MKSKSVSRRSFIHMGVGVAAVATGVKAFADVCGISVAQTAGPFPPRVALPRIPTGGGGSMANPGAKLEVADVDADLTVIEGHRERAAGQLIRLSGTVQDENCEPVSEAVVHLWQADNHGQYNHQNDSSGTAAQLDQHFQYSSVLRTDANGKFFVTTILPRYYPIGGGRVRTAHLHFLVRKLGYETLTTQSYFDGDALVDIERIRELNKSDIILSRGGMIRPELRNLVVTFNMGSTEVPIGDLTLTMQSL